MASRVVDTRTGARHHPVRAAHEVSIGRDPASTPGRLTEADARWPGRLRRIVRVALKHWGCPELSDTAELLVTELATNAFRHGRGRDIAVRFYLQNDRCVIEVNDGSPARPHLRHAEDDDEDGRGLFLVESMADEWGVTPDGTSTWCTLPLTEGTPEMEPAAMTAPVLRDMPLKLHATSSVVAMARLQARYKLTMVGWPGIIQDAVDVLHCLVDNAVAYGLTSGQSGENLGACLRVTEAHELLIDVTDPNPTFSDFDKATSGELGPRSLCEIAALGADLSWFATADFAGKTVRATMRPGRVNL